MSDPRETTVADVLRDNGAQANLKDTDALATEIVNALDREHGAPDEHAADTSAGERPADANAAYVARVDGDDDDGAGAPNA